MIRRLKYAEIDFQLYEQCLNHSLQRNFYAKKQILDALCEEWELLVVKDYEFVMPIPIKRKFGFKFVLMPLFCQQLGIFSKEKDSEIEQRFLDYLQINYRVYTYHFNFQNDFKENLKKRNNYVIETIDYTNLRKTYFKGRKSTVKTAQYLTSKQLNLDEVFQFIKNNFKGLSKDRERERLYFYLNFLDKNELLRLFGAFKNDKLISLAVVTDSGGQFSLLGLVNDENFRADNGASYLIDKILKDNIQNKSLNFMGSNIRGIEVFFKSFGATLQPYPVIEKSRKQLVLNFLK